MSSTNDIKVFKKQSNTETTASETAKQKSFGDTVNNMNDEFSLNCIEE